MYIYYDENGQIQLWNQDDELQAINFNPGENQFDQNMGIDDESVIHYE